MTYNPNIPQATDLISQSQGQLLTNFSQANTAFGVDHTAFDVVALQGKHKKSTYVEQAADPVTAANEMAVYSKDVAGATRLFYRDESAGTVVQATASFAQVTGASPGSSFLPGGIIIKWGTNGDTTNPTNFVSAFPTACFGVTIVGTSTLYTGGFVATAVGTASFIATRTSGAGNTGFYYVAIGN